MDESERQEKINEDVAGRHYNKQVLNNTKEEGNDLKTKIELGI